MAWIDNICGAGSNYTRILSKYAIRRTTSRGSDNHIDSTSAPLTNVDAAMVVSYSASSWSAVATGEVPKGNKLPACPISLPMCCGRVAPKSSLHLNAIHHHLNLWISVIFASTHGYEPANVSHGNQGLMKVQEALPEANVVIFLAHVIGQNGHYDSFRSQE
ncbi:hypothetical protein FOXB_00303 [Fusarium oxysporum f. sp. conglutinans Fo5176]|uniref:Uncharacterized protein n=1 Tax=Fusarium oxysporum (strain Fo5176) TaxID=660025 RepID=F9F1M9_FUSOF|nr:hypothetical protein FOXB_00303 [Fusarium oxysporum f. sp. conglutinans Fo5176]